MDKKRDELRSKMKRKHFNVQSDVSVKQALESVRWYDHNDNMRKLVEWNFWDGENGGPIENLSAFHNIADDYGKQDFGDEERFVTDERGFCRIFETMTQEINLLTHQYRQRL